MLQKQMFLLKLSATVIACTLFFTAFTQIGTLAYEKVFRIENALSEGTFIGPVGVQGLQSTDANQKLNDTIVNWQKANSVNLSFADKKMEFPSRLFLFQIEESIAAAEPGVPNPLYATVTEQAIKEQLVYIVDETMLPFIDIKSLRAKLEEMAGALPSSKTNISLLNFIMDKSLTESKILSQAEIYIPGSGNRFSSLIDSYGEIIIPAKSSFSLLQSLKENGQGIYSNELLTKLASGLYEAILPTNMQVVERNISKELPEGYKAGLEAKIAREKLDFILFNPNDTDIKIRFEKKNKNMISVSVIGMYTGITYKIRFEDKKEVEPKQIIHYADNIETVSKSESKKGRKGYSVTVYRDSYNINGKLLDRFLISEDFYLPVNEVVIKERTKQNTEPVMNNRVGGEGQSDQETTDEVLEGDGQETEVDHSGSADELIEADDSFELTDEEDRKYLK